MQRGAFTAGVLICAVMLHASDASAFDQKRKGFMLGSGFGSYNVVTKQEAPPGYTFTDSYYSCGTPHSIIKVGYGISDHFVAIWNRDFSDMGGLSGVGIKAFLSGRAPSPFVTVGVANLWLKDVCAATLDHEDLGSETGFMFGGGYELYTHWIGEILVTRTTPYVAWRGFDVETKAYSISIHVAYLAY